MSSPSFRFKQFTVWHDKCAMKVGTDGVLLGAWAFLNRNQEAGRGRGKSTRILDVGTGTGLIALMLAQRWSCMREAERLESITENQDFSILGIDIDKTAVEQAQKNFAASPWKNMLQSKEISIQELCHTQCEKFDYIVSNPPYFVDSLKNPDSARQTARHTDTLSYSELMDGIECLLSEDGTAALILPAETETFILSLAAKHKLYPNRLTHVCSKPGKEPIRILVEFIKSQEPVTEEADDIFYIESAHSPRSEEYAELTKEFYL